MTLTADDVRRIAALARIGVDEERIPHLMRELDGILAQMAVLARVTAHAPAAPPDGMPLAADEPGSVPLDRPREALAPEMREGFFIVPRLSTHDGGAGSS